MDKKDLLQCMRDTDWFMEKIRKRSYAQNIYAAMCNNRFMPNEEWAILSEDEGYMWSATWRCAGKIVADLRNQGEDYMDYYCSGISDKDGDEQVTGYVTESTVTDEVRSDLLLLGWIVRPYT